MTTSINPAGLPNPSAHSAQAPERKSIGRFKGVLLQVCNSSCGLAGRSHLYNAGAKRVGVAPPGEGGPSIRSKQTASEPWAPPADKDHGHYFTYLMRKQVVPVKCFVAPPVTTLSK